MAVHDFSSGTRRHRYQSIMTGCFPFLCQNEKGSKSTGLALMSPPTCVGKVSRYLGMLLCSKDSHIFTGG